MKNIDKPFSPQALQDVLQRRLGVPLTSSFVVAYSGGRDSHALLHALCALTEAHSVRIRAVHVNHNLQSLSHQWSEHCRRVCTTLQVPCVIEQVDVKPEGEESIEAAARRLRYSCLAAHVGVGEILLTAHHKDDQAETVLLALLRGTGTYGLAAMPAITKFGAAHHMRPLLGFSRAAIAAYAQAEGLSWEEDTSNRDERMSRNFLRAQILPLLEQRWPTATHALARAATNSADAVTLLNEVAQSDLALCGNKHDASLSLLRLQQLSVVRQRNLVRYWIRQCGFRVPSAQHLDQILTQVVYPLRSGLARVDWSDAQVRRYRDQLIIQPRTTGPDRELVLPWQPSTAVDISDIGWTLRAVAVRGEGLSQVRIAQTALTVRLRRGGEICQLVRRTHHHKLKKLLQQTGVPPWERERIPLIYADKELAAIGDRWVCAPFAAGVDELGWRIVLEPCK